MDAIQLMSQWSSYMEGSANGNGITLPASHSRKISRIGRGSVMGMSGVMGSLGSPSRKRSTAGGNSSIAAALAQAVAYANASAGTPKAGGGEGGFARSSTAPGDISSSMKNLAPFASSKQPFSGMGPGSSWDEAEEHDEANFQDFMPTMAMARKNSQASLHRDTSLKLLNKSKISYREVMEG